VDDETARVFDELREIAASLGLTVHPVSQDESRELGRRAWIRLGYRYQITRSAPGSPLAGCWSVDEASALARFAAFVVECGGSPGAAITLVDEVERRTLAVWPGGLS